MSAYRHSVGREDIVVLPFVASLAERLFRFVFTFVFFSLLLYALSLLAFPNLSYERWWLFYLCAMGPFGLLLFHVLQTRTRVRFQSERQHLVVEVKGLRSWVRTHAVPFSELRGFSLEDRTKVKQGGPRQRLTLMTVERSIELVERVGTAGENAALQEACSQLNELLAEYVPKRIESNLEKTDEALLEPDGGMLASEKEQTL